MTTPSDCLILLLEEYNSDESSFGNKIYVLHDYESSLYLIRGLKDDGDEPFSFTAYDNNHDSVVDFLELFISRDDLCRITLYNFNDLPLTSNEITYDYLEEVCQEHNEVTAYRPDLFSKKTITKIVKVLKNVYNYYTSC